MRIVADTGNAIRAGREEGRSAGAYIDIAVDRRVAVAVTDQGAVVAAIAEDHEAADRHIDVAVGGATAAAERGIADLRVSGRTRKQAQATCVDRDIAAFRRACT